MDNRALFESLIRQTDPYAPYQGAVNAISFTPTRAGQEATGIGVGFAKAILAGLLKGKSEARALEQTSLINDLLRGGDMSASVEGLDPLVEAGIKQAYLTDKQERDAERKDKVESEIFKSVLDNPANARKGIAMLSEMGMYDGELPAVLTSNGAPEFADDTTGKPLSIRDKINRDAKRAMEQGATPNAAIEYAVRINKGDITQADDAKKLAAELFSKADELEQTANISEKAVSQAGQTGGVYSTGLGDALSYLWSGVSSDETAQRAATKELESVKPDLIVASRPPGIGAMSDAEMQAFLGSGALSTNTPSENKAIIDKMRQVARADKEKAGFLNWYIEENGTMSGANELWDQYKQVSPIITRDGKGEFVWNKDRRPWQDVMSELASGRQLQPATGTTARAQTQAPTTGLTSMSTEQIKAMIAAKKGKK